MVKNMVCMTSSPMERAGLHGRRPDDEVLAALCHSEEVRKAAGEEDSTALFLEQSADQANMPEVVTLWRTPTWKRLAQLYNLETQTLNQSEFAAQPTKPTTTGGNLKIEVPLPGRRGIPRSTEGKTKQELCEESRALARWPPLMMRAIATALQLGPLKGKIKLRALSWKEHVAAGHTPFRKDCLVCSRPVEKINITEDPKILLELASLALTWVVPSILRLIYMENKRSTC